MLTYGTRHPLDKEKAKKLYEAGMSDKEIANELGMALSTIGVWRMREGLPSNGGVKATKKKEPATDRCERCVFWQNSTGNDSLYFCHHLLITGKRRKDVNGVCLSLLERKEN